MSGLHRCATCRLSDTSVSSFPAPTHRAAPKGAFPHGRAARRHFGEGALAAPSVQPWVASPRAREVAPRGRSLRPDRNGTTSGLTVLLRSRPRAPPGPPALRGRASPLGGPPP